MEFTNMLIENSSRFVFEAKLITKKSFTTVESFFNYYKLDPNGDEYQMYYTPKLDKKGQKI